MNRNTTTFQCALSAVPVTLLIGVELLSVAAAVVWALSGSLGLGPTATYVLAILFGIPCLVVLFKVAIMAFESEMELKAAAKNPGVYKV